MIKSLSNKVDSFTQWIQDQPSYNKAVSFIKRIQEHPLYIKVLSFVIPFIQWIQSQPFYHKMVSYVISFKPWIQDQPFTTRSIIYLCLLVELWRLIFIRTFDNLIMDPCYVVYYREWYRIISSPFINNSTLELLPLLYIFTIECGIVEREKGSVFALADFILKNAIINIAFIPLEQLLSYYFSDKHLHFHNYGLSAITFMYIFDRWYRNPKSIIHFNDTVPAIKSSHYLNIFIGLNILLYKGIRVVDVIILITAHVYSAELREMIDSALLRLHKDYISKFLKSS